jgi:hypothetical protein
MAQAMTKYQLDHFRDKVKRELDPMIEQQELLVRQYVSQATDTASKKLAKKIGAQSVIDKLKQAEQYLLEAQATAKTFFKKKATNENLITSSLLMTLKRIGSMLLFVKNK